MLQSDAQVSEIRFLARVFRRTEIPAYRKKEQGISPIQPFYAKICPQHLLNPQSQVEFPARQNREAIHDNREAIPPYQARTGN